MEWWCPENDKLSHHAHEYLCAHWFSFFEKWFGFCGKKGSRKPLQEIFWCPLGNKIIVLFHNVKWYVCSDFNRIIDIDFYKCHSFLIRILYILWHHNPFILLEHTRSRTLLTTTRFRDESPIVGSPMLQRNILTFRDYVFSQTYDFGEKNNPPKKIKSKIYIYA